MGLFGIKSLMSKTENISPFKEQWLQAIYTGLSYIVRKNSLSLKLINMGYAGESDLQIDSIDQRDYLQLQLYHHITKEVEIQEKEVLEVGCGIGGGSYYLLQYRNPKQVIGLDLCLSSIKLAKKRYEQNYPNVKFMRANACTFDLAAESQDIVINLESSHCYPDMDAFLERVYKVLRTGGLFCFADIRRKDDIYPLKNALKNSKLSIVKEENISTPVMQSLHLDEDRKRKFLGKHWILRWFGGNTFFVKGSDQYQALENGDYVYLHYILQK